MDIFGSTRWSDIERIFSQDPTIAKQSMENTFRYYWPPAFAYLRASGYNRELAEDLVQGFFEREARNKKVFNKQRGEHGRFRDRIKLALKRYALDEVKAQSRKKRGGRAPHIAITEVEQRIVVEQLDRLSPDAAFDCVWLHTQFERTDAGLRRKYDERGQSERYEVLRGTLPGPQRKDPVEVIAKKLGISERSVSSAIGRFRQEWIDEMLEGLPACDIEDVRAVLKDFLLNLDSRSDHARPRSKPPSEAEPTDDETKPLLETEPEDEES